MKTILSSIFIFLLLSCSNNEDNKSFTPQTINPVLIGQGVNTENVIVGNTVITNQADWEQLMSLFTPAITNTFTETNIDFNNFQLLVVIDTLRPDTGYSINISNVTENKSNIVTTITSVNSGGGFTILSQPYHIVKIPRSSKPVIFQ